MTSREHYVPQFYLKSFADEFGKLIVYDVVKDSFSTQKPEAICFENNLYETKFDGNVQLNYKYVTHNEIEQTLSGYESEFAALLGIIKKRCIKGQNPKAHILEGEQISVLRRFVVNMLVRNPINMEKLRINSLDDDFFKSDFYKQLSFVLSEMGMGGENSLCIAAKKKAFLTFDEEDSLPCNLVKALKDLDYVFFYANEGEFISGDNPVCFGTDPYIKSTNNTCLFFPLTPKVAVLFGNYTDSRKTNNKMIGINKNVVLSLSKQMVDKHHCLRFLFSSKKDILMACISR